MKSNPDSRALLFLLFFLLLGLAAAPPTPADTTVGGTISTDTTWTLSSSPYIVTSSITVQGTGDLATLTIEPGVTVKFNQGTYLNIGASSGPPGALIAQGTAENPILFTANQASPAPGSWDHIGFYDTADDATIMEHCVVEYGGSNDGSFYINHASPTLRNVIVQNSESYGVYLLHGEPTRVIVKCCVWKS